MYWLFSFPLQTFLKRSEQLARSTVMSNDDFMLAPYATDYLRGSVSADNVDKGIYLLFDFVGLEKYEQTRGRNARARILSPFVRIIRSRLENIYGSKTR